MKKILILASAILLFSSMALAQEPVIAKVTWNHRGINTDNYQLCISTDSATQGSCTNYAKGTNEVYIEDLSQSTTYYLELTARGAGGNTPYPEVIWQSPEGPPPPPEVPGKPENIRIGG